MVATTQNLFPAFVPVMNRHCFPLYFSAVLGRSCEGIDFFLRLTASGSPSGRMTLYIIIPVKSQAIKDNRSKAVLELFWIYVVPGPHKVSSASSGRFWSLKSASGSWTKDIHCRCSVLHLGGGIKICVFSEITLELVPIYFAKLSCSQFLSHAMMNKYH